MDIFNRKSEKPIAYGTAGYRTKDEDITDIVCRAYIVCAIRSAMLNKPVGIVLTASHNPVGDNGIKYVDYTGNMFDEEWEEISDRIINCPNKDFASAISRYSLKKSAVYMSRDTRESGKEMIEKCKQAAKALQGEHALMDLGVTSTPQMHFLIRVLSERRITNDEDKEIREGKEILDLYFHRIRSFSALVKKVFESQEKTKIVLDSSNGVGREIFSKIKNALSDTTDMLLLSNSKNLNEACGSDYIKSKRLLPTGVTGEKEACEIETDGGKVPGNTFICAYDGDCDRIVYLRPDTNELIDGDRLSVLFSSFINHLLVACEEEVPLVSVATAYSNGAAMEEMKMRGELKIAGTGVKNLQKEAVKHKITVWFESNGHGTIFFADSVKTQLRKKINYEAAENILDLSKEELDKRMSDVLSQVTPNLSGHVKQKASPYNTMFRPLSKNQASLLLYGMASLFDPYIGDAAVNMALSEGIFYSKFISHPLLLGIYQDLPNVLANIRGNREALTDLFIESVKRKYNEIRVHLRASGTEDLIRIYAEGNSAEALNEALEEIKKMISDL
ncbi:phosphoacetylglucosamine mutase [Nematocida sp. LUAm3]|nr:phosphoacetylglucosamine mutase [Nematocida sp. LUAm3]KAI5174958.1 phosphoacetylglucosamine mutase [Nematocida sp. LUAm2]KAI5177443.1 phosphoacetylglucosamine mutase [Nematocida sp. LUAm1]